MRTRLARLLVTLFLLLASATSALAQEMVVVTSLANDGPGTLREALLRATPGTTITFDPTVFPLDAPATIYVEGEPLPPITAGNLTIDASEAGVILDGSRGNPEDPWFVGLNLRSDDNVVKGMGILNFPSSGIWIAGDGNVIGGRNATPGGSCSGDCNLVSGNGWAAMGGEGGELEVRQIETRSEEEIPRVGNVISGNYIGTDATGTRVYGESGVGIFLYFATQTLVGGDSAAERNVIGGHRHGIFYDGTGNVIKGNYVGIGVSGEPLPNETGIWLREARDAIIGPDNVIAFNTDMGLNIRDENTGVTITRNSIFANGPVPLSNISSDIPRGAITVVPFIFLNNDDGNVKGSTIPGATVEIFSGDDGGARYYEGTVIADSDGDFSFSAPDGGFAGDRVTAMATSQDGTSSFLAVAVRPQPAPPAPPFVALEGIPRPAQVSLEPEDIGISLGLAVIAVLYFGFTSSAFNALLEDFALDLNNLLPGSLSQRWGRPRPLRAAWQVAIAWLAILLLTAVIESFLKPGPFFSRERLAVFLALLVGALIINAADLLIELWFRKRVRPQTRFEFEPVLVGLLIAIAAVVLSRLMHFEPGYVYGIVGVMLLLPAMPRQHAGRHALLSIITLLVISLLAWLLTLLASAATALESILLMLFLLSVEAAFFGMLPILTNKGRVIWQWRRKAWALLMVVVFFVFFHLLLQPGFEDVELLQQNSLQTVAILMGIFGICTLVLWLFVTLRGRSTEAEAATD